MGARFLLLAATVSAATAGRTAVPFGYAWRFHYGDDPSSPPGSGPGTCAFEEDLQDYQLSLQFINLLDTLTEKENCH